MPTVSHACIFIARHYLFRKKRSAGSREYLQEGTFQKKQVLFFSTLLCRVRLANFKTTRRSLAKRENAKGPAQGS